MIKRDILENSIREKLHDHQAEPPKDMWASIESDLNKITAPRRSIPLARRIASYSVAATLLIASITLGVIYNSEPPAIADIIESVPAVVQPEALPHIQLGTQIASVATHKSEIAVGQGFARQNTEMLSTTQPKARIVEPARTAMADDNAAVVARADVEAETTTDKQIKQLKTTNKPEQKQAPQATSKSQATRWYNQIDQPTKQSRRTRKSTSLYAANIGMGGTDVSSGNVVQRATSEFRIQETNSLTGMSSPMVKEYNPESLRHHAPLSFGLSFSWAIGKRFDIETGLTYTYLKSDADTNSQLFSYKQKQELHYLGIPVSVRYNIIGNRYFGLYARVGAMVERSIYAKFSTKITQGESSSVGNNTSALSIDGVQSSVSVGAGAEYKFTKLLALYLEPNLNYYFANNSQPINYRTENKLNFGLKAGFRVNFR